MKHEKRTDYVRVASFIFLDKYRRKYDSDSSGVLYNKYITLLNTKLMDEKNIDIGLPHCWYRWGDVVVKYYVPYLGWNHSDMDITAVTFKGNEPVINLNDSVVCYISEYADEFIDEHGCGIEGVESAIDKVYENAPFEFQNKYRRLREASKLMNSSLTVAGIGTYLQGLLDEAMECFPKEFRSINAQKNEFVAVFKAAVENSAPADSLFDIIEDFWFFFCYYLRIKCNYNIKRETLRIWQDRLPMENSRFETSIQNFAKQYCGNSDNKTVAMLLKKREERLADLDAMLNELE